jgi:EAL domain-containing protein (putative c-di-GMP-specific phosphodiesterase class I)
MELTSAVIAMAHKLRYKVVAEGVETAEQVAFLQASECDYGQGYFFAKPLTFADLVDFCQQRQHKTSFTN